MMPGKKSKPVLTVSLLIIISGALAMGIMLFNFAGLEQWYQKRVDIKFNNALCVTLVGVYYLLFKVEPNKKTNPLFFILSSFIIAISALTLAEYIFNISTGIDQLFVADKRDIAAHDPFPGRLRWQVAVVILFFGLSLFGFSTKSRLAHILAQYALHFVSFIIAILLIGFIFNDAFLQNLRVYGFSYLIEGVLVFVMSITGTFLYPSLGLAGLFTGNMVGNKMARRLFVLMGIIILFFAAIKTKYFSFKLWQFDTSLSLFIMCILLAALLIIWYTANWLNKVDATRYKAEHEIKVLNEELEQRVQQRTEEILSILEKYRESELKFRSLAEQSMVGIYIVQNGKFIYVNPCFASVFGYTPEELINTVEVTAIIDEHYRETSLEYVRRRITGEETSVHYEAMGKKKDGSANWVEFYGSRAVMGGEPTIIGSMIDITKRKRAEEELRSSENKYKLLFESSPQALWMIAKNDLSIISVNDAAARLYGYTKEELLQKNVSIFRPPEDLAKQSEIFLKDFNSSSDLGVVKHVKKDGSVIFVRMVAHDIIFEGKKVRLSLTTDVTGKLEAEDNLQRSEANLRTILDTTDTAYALLDKNLNVMAVNQVAAKFVNLKLNKYAEKGRQFIDALLTERFPRFRSYADDVLNGKNISYEVNYPQADGSAVFFNIRMFPIKNKENEIFGLMLELVDITGIKKYTNAIEEQNEKFREIAWLQSHIVRAPLARMMGIINLIKDNDLDIEEHREFLAHLATSAAELDSIIKDITDKTVAIS